MSASKSHRKTTPSRRSAKLAESEKELERVKNLLIETRGMRNAVEAQIAKQIEAEKDFDTFFHQMMIEGRIAQHVDLRFGAENGQQSHSSAHTPQVAPTQFIASAPPAAKLYENRPYSFDNNSTAQQSIPSLANQLHFQSLDVYSSSADGQTLPVFTAKVTPNQGFPPPPPNRLGNTQDYVGEEQVQQREYPTGVALRKKFLKQLETEYEPFEVSKSPYGGPPSIDLFSTHVMEAHSATSSYAIPTPMESQITAAQEGTVDRSFQAATDTSQVLKNAGRWSKADSVDKREHVSDTQVNRSHRHESTGYRFSGVNSILNNGHIYPQRSPPRVSIPPHQSLAETIARERGISLTPPRKFEDRAGPQHNDEVMEEGTSASPYSDNNTHEVEESSTIEAIAKRVLSEDKSLTSRLQRTLQLSPILTRNQFYTATSPTIQLGQERIEQSILINGKEKLGESPIVTKRVTSLRDEFEATVAAAEALNDVDEAGEEDSISAECNLFLETVQEALEEVINIRVEASRRKDSHTSDNIKRPSVAANKEAVSILQGSQSPTRRQSAASHASRTEGAASRVGSIRTISNHFFIPSISQPTRSAELAATVPMSLQEAVALVQQVGKVLISLITNWAGNKHPGSNQQHGRPDGSAPPIWLGTGLHLFIQLILGYNDVDRNESEDTQVAFVQHSSHRLRIGPAIHFSYRSLNRREVDTLALDISDMEKKSKASIFLLKIRIAAIRQLQLVIGALLKYCAASAEHSQSMFEEVIFSISSTKIYSTLLSILPAVTAALCMTSLGEWSLSTAREEGSSQHHLGPAAATDDAVGHAATLISALKGQSHHLAIDAIHVIDVLMTLLSSGNVLRMHDGLNRRKFDTSTFFPSPMKADGNVSSSGTHHSAWTDDFQLQIEAKTVSGDAKGAPLVTARLLDLISSALKSSNGLTAEVKVSSSSAYHGSHSLPVSIVLYPYSQKL